MSSEITETVLRLPDDVQDVLRRERSDDQEHTARALITSAVRQHLLGIVQEVLDVGFIQQDSAMNPRRRRIDATTWEALARASEACGLSRAELMALCLRRALSINGSVDLTRVERAIARIDTQE